MNPIQRAAAQADKIQADKIQAAYKNMEDVSAAAEFEQVAKDAPKFEDWVEGARHAVEHKRFVVVQGVVIDIFSASAMIQVFDKVNPVNQARMQAMGVMQAHGFAFEVIKRANKIAAAR